MSRGRDLEREWVECPGLVPRGGHSHLQEHQGRDREGDRLQAGQGQPAEEVSQSLRKGRHKKDYSEGRGSLVTITFCLEMLKGRCSS